jgi:hypothetical protein
MYLKCDWKTFLKPTKAKLLLFIALAVFGGYFGFFVFTPRVFGVAQYGTPLVFNSQTCGAPTGNYGTDVFACNSSLNVLNVVLDLVFWYLVACILMTAYEKWGKK